MTTPTAMRDVICAAVEAALDGLPPQLQERLENVAISVEEVDPADPHVYGLYEGTPLPERSHDGLDLMLPDRIRVFCEPLVADFGHDRDLLAHEARVTLLHEVGHYFGIDEDRLEELGWA